MVGLLSRFRVSRFSRRFALFAVQTLLIALCVSAANRVLLAAPSLQDLTAEEIINRLNSRERGQTMARAFDLTVIGPTGEAQPTRSILELRKHTPEGWRSAFFFTAPENFRGLGMLMWEIEATGKDLLWLYIPTTQKTIQVYTSGQTGLAVAGDFYYEDLKQNFSLQRYDIRLLRQEPCDGATCYVLESHPHDPGFAADVGARQLGWVRSDIWLPVKAEFYDLDGQTLARTYRAEEIQNIQGFWTVTRMSMIHNSQNRQSLVKVTGVEYNVDLPDQVFETAGLGDGPPQLTLPTLVQSESVSSQATSPPPGPSAATTPVPAAQVGDQAALPIGIGVVAAGGLLAAIWLVRRRAGRSGL